MPIFRKLLCPQINEAVEKVGLGADLLAVTIPCCATQAYNCLLYTSRGGCMKYNSRAARNTARRVIEYAITISIALLCSYGIVNARW